LRPSIVVFLACEWRRSTSVASHRAFDAHPFATRQQRDTRIGKKPSSDLRSERLFKAVLKA